MHIIYAVCSCSSYFLAIFFICIFRSLSDSVELKKFSFALCVLFYPDRIFHICIGVSLLRFAEILVVNIYFTCLRFHLCS